MPGKRWGLGLMAMAACSASGLEQVAPEIDQAGVESTFIEEPGLGTFEVFLTEPSCHYVDGDPSLGLVCADGPPEDVFLRLPIWQAIEGMIARAREAKSEHPEWPVRLVAASDFFHPMSIYNLCALGQSGVDVLMIGDDRTSLLDHPCEGATPLGIAGEGRLIEMKLLLLDYGTDERPAEIGFGSAPQVPSSTSHDSFIVARLPRSSDFVRRHFCAVEGLEACAEGLCDAPGRFRSDRFRACVAASTTPPDPRLQAIYSPTEDEALETLLASAVPAVQQRAWIESHTLADPDLGGYLAALATRPSPASVAVLLDADAREGPQATVTRGLLNSAGVPVRYLSPSPNEMHRMGYTVLDDTVVLRNHGYVRNAATGTLSMGSRAPSIGFTVVLRIPALTDFFARHFEKAFAAAQP